MNRDYKVFISHAGPDKIPLAIPLYEKLRQQNIHAFVDREELHPGDNAPHVMEYAMKTASIGIFILSPEFVARKWTLMELMCFQQREQEAIANGMPVPRLIPVFYRLGVHDCRDSSIFYKKNERGESIFFENKFFDRVLKGNTSMQQVVDSMKQISERTGIENNLYATNDTSAEMELKRLKLVDYIVEVVVEAMQKVEHSAADDKTIWYSRLAQQHNLGTTESHDLEEDHFVPHFEAWQNPRYVSIRMSDDCVDQNQISSEAKAKWYLMDDSVVNPMIVIQGMAGVGKTCILRALCHDQDVKNRFKDGVYVISLGADASIQSFISALCKAVTSSGGQRKRREILNLGTAESTVNEVMKWFCDRSCLFLVDDVWSSSSPGKKCLDWLSRITMKGQRSAVIITTREKELLMHKTVTHGVRLYAHEPRGPHSRRIVLQCATNTSDISLSKSTELVFNAILDKCAGLPVALAVTGRSIRRLALNLQDDFERAFQMYYNFASDSEESILEREADDYSSLSRALSISLSILSREEKSGAIAQRTYLYKEMHRSLSVIQKQQWVPLTTLCRLWKLDSGKDANFVLDRLSDVGLADVQFQKYGEVEVKGLRLHDLVHDFAVKNALSSGEQEAWHERLLQNYNISEDEDVEGWKSCRTWWTTKQTVDNYLEENLIRHLVKAEQVQEAVVLAGRPQWIVRHLKTCGILLMEKDFSLITQHLSQKVSVFDDVESIRNDLALLLNAIRLSVTFILENPQEVYFQLSARLIRSKNSSKFMQNVVDYADKHAMKPSLRPITQCLQTAENIGGKVFHCRKVSSATVIESERTMYTGTKDGRIFVFDLDSVEAKTDWQAHDEEIARLEVSRNGRFLVSSSRRIVRAFDIRNEHAEVFGHQFSQDIWCFSLSPDSKIAFVAYREHVTALSLESGELFYTFTNIDGRWVTSLSVSPDGRKLATGSFSGQVNISSIQRDENTTQDWLISRTFRSIYRFVTSWAGSATQSNMTSNAKSEEMNSLNSQGYVNIGNLKYIINEICFSGDGKQLATASENAIKVYNIETGTPIVVLEGQESLKFFSIVEENEEQKILVASGHGEAKVYNLNGTLLQVGEFAERGREIEFVHITQTTNKLLWGADNCVHLVDMRDLAQQQHSNPAKHEREVISMCITPDGSRAVTGGVDNNVMVWDTQSGLLVGEVLKAHPHIIHSVIITPDGQKIVTFSNYFVVVWDLPSQKKLVTFDAHTNAVLSLKVTLDSKYAITGSRDQTVRVWDLEECSGKHFVLDDHRSNVRKIHIEQHGKQFLSLSETEGILWSIGPTTCVKEKEIEQEDICFMRIDQINVLFDVTLVTDAKLQVGDAIIEREAYWKHLLWKQGGQTTVLASLDVVVSSLQVSAKTKTLCLGLRSGGVSMLRLELD